MKKLYCLERLNAGRADLNSGKIPSQLRSPIQSEAHNLTHCLTGIRGGWGRMKVTEIKDIKYCRELIFENVVNIDFQTTKTLPSLLTAKMHFSSALISALLILAPATFAEAHNGQNKASKSYADTYLAIRTAVNAFSFAVDTRHAQQHHSTTSSRRMQSWTSASLDRNKSVPPTSAHI